RRAPAFSAMISSTPAEPYHNCFPPLPVPLDELETHAGEHHHSDQQPAVSPARDVGLAVSALCVANRHVNDLQIELGSAEDEIEIAEWIELPEVASISRDQVVVLSTQHLGAAKRVLDFLSQQPRKSDREKLVSDQVEEAHRPRFHRVNQPHAVDEFALARAQYFIETRQVFGRHRQVGVEYHQHLTLGCCESGANRVAFPASGLANDLDAPGRIPGRRPLDGGVGAVGGMTFDEDQFGTGAHLGDTAENILDVTGFVAGGYYHAHQRFSIARDFAPP